MENELAFVQNQIQANKQDIVNLSKPNKYQDEDIHPLNDKE